MYATPFPLATHMLYSVVQSFRFITNFFIGLTYFLNINSTLSAYGFHERFSPYMCELLLLDRSILSCELHFFVFWILDRYLHLGIHFNIERQKELTTTMKLYGYTPTSIEPFQQVGSIHLHLYICLHLIRNVKYLLLHWNLLHVNSTFQA